MKYKGEYVYEMKPSKWDGKSREMLCWHVTPEDCDDKDCSFFKEVIVGFHNGEWYSILGYKYKHCAEVPKVSNKEPKEPYTLEWFIHYYKTLISSRKAKEYRKGWAGNMLPLLEELKEYRQGGKSSIKPQANKQYLIKRKSDGQYFTCTCRFNLEHHLELVANNNEFLVDSSVCSFGDYLTFVRELK